MRQHIPDNFAGVQPRQNFPVDTRQCCHCFKLHAQLRRHPVKRYRQLAEFIGADNIHLCREITITESARAFDQFFQRHKNPPDLYHTEQQNDEHGKDNAAPEQGIETRHIAQCIRFRLDGDNQPARQQKMRFQKYLMIIGDVRHSTRIPVKRAFCLVCSLF